MLKLFANRNKFLLLLILINRFLIGAPLFHGRSNYLGKVENSPWEMPAPYVGTIVFSDTGRKSARIIIKNKQGCPIYMFECHLNAFEFSTDDFNYSGAFECRLLPLYEDTEQYPTLLANTKNMTRDWESYGRFLLSDFIKSNNKNVITRNCYLRGMRIIFELKNWNIVEKNSKPRLNSVTFTLRVIPDPNILQAYAFDDNTPKN